MFSRIRLSLTLWYVAVLLGIVAVIAGVTYAVLYESLSSEVDDSLESSARQITAQISEDSLAAVEGNAEGPEFEDEGDEDHEDSESEEEEREEHGVRFFGATSGDTFYLVLDPAGSLVLNPLNVNVPGIPDASSASEAAQDGSDWQTLTSESTDYRLYSEAVRHDGATIAVVQVGRSLEEHQEQLRMLIVVLAGTGVGGLGLAAAGGLFVAGRALRPVREAFSRQRAFVADASHELRTPLTLLRGNAEIMQMEAGDRLSPADSRALSEIVRQAGQIERLIGDMSTLARMDEGQLLLHPAPIDAAPLLQEAATDARALSGDKVLDIDVETRGDLHLIADEARVREVLLGLVDNAVRYTPAGGKIMLIGTGSDAFCDLVVSDTGPGIPPQQWEHIFERFYRVDASRSRQEGGSGLGLAIGRAIAEAHGGTLTVSGNQGAGAVFTLRLPRRGPPTSDS
jgi:signal transduction histidine kinase